MRLQTDSENLWVRVNAHRRTAKTDQSAWMRLEAESETWSAYVDAPSGGWRKLISLRGCALRPTAKTNQTAWMRLEADSENRSACVNAQPASGGQWNLISLRRCALLNNLHRCVFRRTEKTDQPSWMRLHGDSENWSACVDAPSGGQWKLISLHECAFRWRAKTLISLRGCAFRLTEKTDQPAWTRLQADSEDIGLRGCTFRRTVKTDQPAWMRLQADSEDWSVCVDAPSGEQWKLISLRVCAFRQTLKLNSLRGCAFRRTAKTSACVGAPSGE